LLALSATLEECAVDLALVPVLRVVLEDFTALE
jgi:hypothetical protein